MYFSHLVKAWNLRNTGRWMVLAVAIGAITGVGAILFHMMLHQASAFFMHSLAGFYAPVAGGGGVEGGGFEAAGARTAEDEPFLLREEEGLEARGDASHDGGELTAAVVDHGPSDRLQDVGRDRGWSGDAEVDLLLGDSTKARDELGWQPKTTFVQLIKKMVDKDVASSITW